MTVEQFINLVTRHGVDNLIKVAIPNASGTLDEIDIDMVAMPHNGVIRIVVTSPAKK